MTDIIERLRNRALAAAIIKDKPDLYNDAADAIIRLRERLAEADEANRRVSDENKKLRAEIMSDYHEGLEEGVKAERERCARVAEQARDDTCDGPVAWSMADSIAAAIRESGDEA